MGYRSDVAIAIHKDLQGDFLTFLKTEQIMAQIFGDMSDFKLDKDFQGEGHWLFTCNSVKWYTNFDDYKDIQVFEKFFEEMDRKSETEEKYRFLRIGEEIDDIEYRGDWWESELYVSREIRVGY